MNEFASWASVKVINDQSEHFGRAGVVVRKESNGYAVRLDATSDKAEVIVNFAPAEISGL